MRSRTAGFAGLAIGLALGGLFGLAVVSFADCAGPDCTYQRVVGVLAHAAGVGVAGAIAGLLVEGLVRSVQRFWDRPQ
jgi:hypothetical protein